MTEQNPEATETHPTTGIQSAPTMEQAAALAQAQVQLKAAQDEVAQISRQLKSEQEARAADAEQRAKVFTQTKEQLRAAEEKVGDLARQLKAEQERAVAALKDVADLKSGIAAIQAQNNKWEKEMDMLRTKDAAGADASLVQFLNEACAILERCQFASGETIEHPHRRASKCLTCGGNNVRGHEAGCEVARALVGHRARASKTRQ